MLEEEVVKGEGEDSEHSKDNYYNYYYRCINFLKI